MKNFSMGRLGQLFNAVIPECFYRGSQPLKNTTRFPNSAGRRSFGNDVRRGHIGGFTLIELLVVVLIIGILAAVALPQYRVAVERARVVKALPVLRSIMDARERTFLANGSYSTDLEDLDIGISYTSKHDYGEGTEYEGTLIGYFRLPKGSSCVYSEVKQGAIVIDFCSGRKECYGLDTVAERVCASLGKKSHVYNGRNVYKLDF